VAYGVARNKTFAKVLHNICAILLSLSVV